VQQIADWLEKLGLSEYAQRFAENDIDFTILTDLTDQDQVEVPDAAGRSDWTCFVKSATMPAESSRGRSRLECSQRRLSA
jgi:hypothetical protein